MSTTLNTNELKAAIVRKGYTQAEVAAKLGISPKTFWRKMKLGTFGTDEAKVLIDELGITNPVAIFFADEVTCEVTDSEGRAS